MFCQHAFPLALDNPCDIGDICAQICIPTPDSYKCECYKGYTLMADKISCKPDKKSPSTVDRCSVNNPCEHKCIDTGVAIKCACTDGFELAADKRSCKGKTLKRPLLQENKIKYYKEKCF